MSKIIDGIKYSDDMKMVEDAASKDISSAVIADGVTKIGERAFHDCSSISSVVIPESVTEIGNGAFSGCSSLASVEFGGTKAQWDAVKGKKELFLYVPATSVKCADGEWQKPVLLVEAGIAVKCLDKSATSVEIPAGITKIGGYAFKGCTSLSSVVIPAGVTEIDGWAFEGCTSLSSVEIPESVKEIGWGAFRDCSSLASVVISAGVTEIDRSAFEGCSSLASVEFGGTKAQWNAVKGKEGLFLYVPATSVKCADGEWQKPVLLVEAGVAVKLLDKTATSVKIPDGVTEIGVGAFEGCKSLASVVIPEGVTKIGGYAFDGCSSLASVVIPAGVTEIDESAFEGCTSLASVVIPAGVTEIGWQAFFGCPSLLSMEFAGTMADWEAVKKGNAWNNGVPAKSVKCSDGDAEL